MDLAEMKVEVMRLVGGLHKEATEKSLGNTEALCTGVKLLVEALESENAALRAELAARGPVLSEHKPLQAADDVDMAVYQSIADSYNNKLLVLSEVELGALRYAVSMAEFTPYHRTLRNLLERAKR